MKQLTKEWNIDLELHELFRILNFDRLRKIPLVFLNGNTSGIEADLYTVKTNLNVSDKENQISFMLLPDTFDYYTVSNDPTEPHMKTFESEFFSQYINRLRIISCLPDYVLEKVNDKRMLALGYADNEIKIAIKNFIGDKYDNALYKWELSNKKSEAAGRELTAFNQFKKFPYTNSFHNLLQETYITDFKEAEKEIRLTVDSGTTAILTEAKKIKEECNPESAYVIAYELYKKAAHYELHFLLSKRDKFLIENFYYATYIFKDLKLEY